MCIGSEGQTQHQQQRNIYFIPQPWMVESTTNKSTTAFTFFPLCIITPLWVKKLVSYLIIPPCERQQCPVQIMSHTYLSCVECLMSTLLLWFSIPFNEVLRCFWPLDSATLSFLCSSRCFLSAESPSHAGQRSGHFPDQEVFFNVKSAAGL